METDRKIDTIGMKCPIPVLRASKELRAMSAGETLLVEASDGQAPRDFTDMCNEMGHDLLKNEEVDGTYIIVIKKG
ncbi:sulfurtransferase TusA family protein [Terasakiella sp. A23]|uniref:sulfurtransferase TusA family protein n=1 Tax=Terasakiella sp. FCG-A23 TaxID=3080561 RepID=UPI0029534BCC|nr:sulfurtransferase TusA family protein [Terasakiella sp. A23]MDV7340134.1 sulfurtransferase TusA family protein [Terasakiella sp. A23]